MAQTEIWGSISGLDMIIFFLSMGFLSAVFYSVYRHILRDVFRERLQSIAFSTKRQARARYLKEKSARRADLRRDNWKNVENFMKTYFSRLTEDKANDYRIAFERAGWNSVQAPFLYPFMILVFIVGSVFLSVLVTEANPFLDRQKGLIKIAIYMASALVGGRLTDLLFGILISIRLQNIRRDLSSALDLLVICTNAGLSIDRSLEYVAREMGSVNPDLCKELLLTAIELNILPTRAAAFRNLARRVDLPLVRSMATTLIQSEEQGTSISSTLKLLAADFREQKMMELEAKASRLPAILAVPVVLFTLPSLMIMILGPTIITLIHEMGGK